MKLFIIISDIETHTNYNVKKLFFFFVSLITIIKRQKITLILSKLNRKLFCKTKPEKQTNKKRFYEMNIKYSQSQK